MSRIWTIALCPIRLQRDIIVKFQLDAHQIQHELNHKLYFPNNILAANASREHRVLFTLILKRSNQQSGEIVILPLISGLIRIFRFDAFFRFGVFFKQQNLAFNRNS